MEQFNLDMKILVVDDMLTIRKINIQILKKLGFKNIKDAADGREGLNQILSALEIKQPFDLLITDWNMPIMNGLELLQEVRKEERTKNLKVLMVTAEGEKENILMAVKAGVSNYIVKPFTPETLNLKLKKIYNIP